MDSWCRFTNQYLHNWRKNWSSINAPVRILAFPSHTSSPTTRRLFADCCYYQQPAKCFDMWAGRRRSRRMTHATADDASSSWHIGRRARACLTPHHPRQILHPCDRRGRCRRCEAPAVAGRHYHRRRTIISAGYGHGWCRLVGVLESWGNTT